MPGRHNLGASSVELDKPAYPAHWAAGFGREHPAEDLSRGDDVPHRPVVALDGPSTRSLLDDTDQAPVAQDANVIADVRAWEVEPVGDPLGASCSLIEDGHDLPAHRVIQAQRRLTGQAIDPVVPIGGDDLLELTSSGRSALRRLGRESGRSTVEGADNPASPFDVLDVGGGASWRASRPDGLTGDGSRQPG